MPKPTSKARLVITALFVDHQTPAEVAARYGVHRAWVYKLKARYEAEGETALEPRSRRPKTSPVALSPEVVDLIVRVRKELADAGLDAGPETIAWHLQHHHGHRVSRSTISRHLTHAGLISPEPKKRPKSSYIRFQAAMPNETWQSDFKCRRRHLKSMTQVWFGASAVKSRSSRSPARLPSLAGIVVRIPLERRIPCRPRDRIARSTDPGDTSRAVRCTRAVIFRRP